MNTRDFLRSFRSLRRVVVVVEREVFWLKRFIHTLRVAHRTTHCLYIRFRPSSQFLYQHTHERIIIINKHTAARCRVSTESTQQQPEKKKFNQRFSSLSIFHLIQSRNTHIWIFGCDAGERVSSLLLLLVCLTYSLIYPYRHIHQKSIWDKQKIGASLEHVFNSNI